MEVLAFPIEACRLESYFDRFPIEVCAFEILVLAVLSEVLIVPTLVLVFPRLV